MSADDTNLFFSHSDINVLFEKMNNELMNVSDCLNANKLPSNVTKTKYSFFHKSSKTGNIPLRLQPESSIKFLVWIEENLTWRDHIHTVAYIHAYLNYANMQTHKSKLKKVQSKQKHALRIIFNQSKTSPSEPLCLS